MIFLIKSVFMKPLFLITFIKRLRNFIVIMMRLMHFIMYIPYQKQQFYHRVLDRFKWNQNLSNQISLMQLLVGSKEEIKVKATFYLRENMSSSFFIVVVEINSTLMHFVISVMVTDHV